MRAPFASLVLVAALLCLPARRSLAQPASRVGAPPALKAAAAILVDVASGEVLYEKNADLPRQPASTTKIMTAILLMERTQPQDVIVASAAAAQADGSSLHLVAGERISARDLLYALLLRSANDGCVAAAEHIAGSEARFAQMMTEKAREIGATSTVFRNCNGLNSPPNVTTARDLATMARYAMRFPQFNEATRTHFYTVSRTVDRRDSVLKNHAYRFLMHFPGADGVKTGYTVPAGHCFVGSATWNGWRLLGVVLKSPDSMGETGQLLKYGFARFASRETGRPGQVYGAARVSGGVQDVVDGVSPSPLRYVVTRGSEEQPALRPRLDEVAAPVMAGTPVGTLDLWLRDRVVARYPLVAASSVPRAYAPATGAAGGGWVLWAVIGSLVVGYGTAFAKGARGRGHRLSSVMRGTDRSR